MSDQTVGRKRRRADTSRDVAAVNTPEPVDSTALSTTTNRSVATLTPDQLARKRQNDRQAQRAIRERTKTLIEQLRGRIAELEQSDPHQDLQAAVQMRIAAERDSESMRAQIQSVLPILSRLVADEDGDGVVGGSDSRADRSASSPVSDPSSGPASLSGQVVRRTGGDRPDQRLGVDFLLDHSHRLNPDDGSVTTVATATTTADVVDQTAPRLRFTPTGAVGIRMTGISAPLVGHNILPRHVAPTCPLDRILLNFMQERHGMASQGVSLAALVGPPYPNFSPLLDGRPAPGRTGQHQNQDRPVHPASKIFTDIIHTFPDLFRLPDQVAIVYIHFLLMRWHIAPTKEHYDALPEWIRPRPNQLFCAHPAWMDSIPWPLLRDHMVQMDPVVDFEAFFVPYTADFLIDWPFKPEDCLVPISSYPTISTSGSASGSAPASSLSLGPPSSFSVPSGASFPSPSPSSSSIVGSPHEPSAMATLAALQGPWMINPVFESRVRDLSYWSLGKRFRDTFPDLTHLVRV